MDDLQIAMKQLKDLIGEDKFYEELIYTMDRDAVLDAMETIADRYDVDLDNSDNGCFIGEGRLRIVNETDTEITVEYMDKKYTIRKDGVWNVDTVHPIEDKYNGLLVEEGSFEFNSERFECVTSDDTEVLQLDYNNDNDEEYYPTEDRMVGSVENVDTYRDLFCNEEAMEAIAFEIDDFYSNGFASVKDAADLFDLCYKAHIVYFDKHYA